MSLQQSIAENLKRLDMTPADLIRATGLPRMRVYRIVNGVNERVDVEAVKAIEQALGVELIKQTKKDPRIEFLAGELNRLLPTLTQPQQEAVVSQLAGLVDLVKAMREQEQGEYVFRFR